MQLSDEDVFADSMLMANKMLSALQGEVSVTILGNALGHIVLTIWSHMDHTPQDRLAEFDSWAANVRGRIERLAKPDIN